MAVVAARVHLAFGLRCVRDAGLLVDVERIEVGAQADRIAASSPWRSTPTTPVPAIPVCTSSPNERSLSATNALVAFSSNAVSGCAWM